MWRVGRPIALHPSSHQSPDTLGLAIFIQYENHDPSATLCSSAENTDPGRCCCPAEDRT